MRKFLPYLFSALLVIVIGAGCGSKVNQSNFEKITTDMTQEQVQDILGKPTEASATDLGIISGASAKWKSGDSTIVIQFVNGKVLSKSFVKDGDSEKKTAQ